MPRYASSLPIYPFSPVPFPPSSTIFFLYFPSPFFFTLSPISSPSFPSFLLFPLLPLVFPLFLLLPLPPRPLLSSHLCAPSPFPLPTSPLNPPPTISPPPRQSRRPLARANGGGKGRLGPSDWLPGLARQLKSRPTQRVSAPLQHLLLAEGTVSSSGCSSRRRPQSLGE